MSNDQAFLEARNVSKAFFGNQALRDVSIELIPGRIHALLGENGAGKSTLINLLSGALTPDSGEILVDGRAVALTPRNAHRLGVAVVQQELSLAPHLSIAENIALGAYPRRWGLVDYGRLAALVEEVGSQLGLIESADTPVSRLPTGRRQVVEIAKALATKPRVLILDEPTSSLAAPDVAMLMRLVRRLRDQRVAILYISHRLNEIIDFCDYVTVLKDGAVTADRPLAGLDPSGLVRLMVGRDPQNLFPHYAPQFTDDLVLEAGNFRSGGATGVDFRLRRGEILGVGGLVGHGQEDFMLGLYGAAPAKADRFWARGGDGSARTAPFADVTEANASGVAYVPADRRKEGLLLPHSIDFNLLLAVLCAPRGGAPAKRDGDGNHRKSRAPAQHPRRPAPADPGPVRRKPAKGRRVQVAAARAVGAAAQRPHPWRRRRDEAGDLCRLAGDGGRRQGRGPGQHRHPRACPPLRSRDGVPQRRIAATLDHAEASEEAIVAAAMGLSDAPAREGATV